MRVLTGAIAALALVASTGAHAQGVYLAEPAPAPSYGGPAYVAPPVVVAPGQPYVGGPSPYVGGPSAAYAYVPGPTGSVVVNPRTGRSCRIEPDGYRWCWTP
jgi:hypothetical protein